jgi:hypothetical protein
MADEVLYITNGDVANQYFRSIGLQGDFLSWDDVLHIGPITNHSSLARSSNIRAAYLASLGWGTLEFIQNKFDQRDQRFVQAVKNLDCEIVIWNSFELFDQLQLMQICSWLYVNAPDSPSIKVIFVEDYLGEKSIPAEKWLALAKNASSLSFAQIQLGHQCWQAYTHKTPEALAEIYLNRDLSLWPFLKQALERLLQELPEKKSGISRTEALILKALRRQNLSLNHIFQTLGQSESIRFMADLPFLVILDEMINSDLPLIEPEDHGPFNAKYSKHPSRDWTERLFCLTEAGESVFTKHVDWLSQHAINRWWGGCHLTSVNDWRWDSSVKQLLEYSRYLGSNA